MKNKLNFEITYPHAIETVWKALTSADAMRDWLMKGTFTPVPGSQFQMEEEGLHVSGRVLCVDAPHMLQYEWVERRREDEGDAGTPSLVTWNLSPAPSGGTLVKIDHEFLVTPTPVAQAETSVNWMFVLHSRFPVALRGANRPPTPIVYVLETPESDLCVLSRAGFRQEQAPAK